MKNNFKKSISLATGLLLGVPIANAVDSESDTSINTSILYYSEEDRVTVIAPQVNIKTSINEDNLLSVTLLHDTVTGSSPTGEVPTGIPQTITSSSGSVSTIAGDEKPRKSFEDVRQSVSFGLTHNYDRLLKISSGFSNSEEQDYKSTNYSLNFTRDTEDRSRTWSLGGSYTTDSITGTDSLDGVGGLPMPLTNAANKLRQSASDDKQAKEFKIGLTQVINAKSLVQLSYTKNISTGYHNDPYKLVSLVDSNGISTASLYESRPDSRDRNVFFGEYTLFVDGDVLKLDYRFFNDDWGINSNTFGVKYRWAQSENLYIEPHFRYYTQSAADFHQFYLEDSSPVPTNISSDSRLSAFNSTTLGVKVGYNFANYEISGRIEKMQQKTNESFSDAPGQLSGYDLFAPINALIAQVNFSVKF